MGKINPPLPFQLPKTFKITTAANNQPTNLISNHIGNPQKKKKESYMNIGGLGVSSKKNGIFWEFFPNGGPPPPPHPPLLGTP